MTVAEVILWGTKIGTVVFDRETGLGSFEYDPAFLASGIEVSPIAMPLSRRVYAFPELMGLALGVCPFNSVYFAGTFLLTGAFAFSVSRDMVLEK